MIVTFLGTSAANAFPEAFCSCVNCVAARGEGGKSLRKRSAILINNDLLIDLGPDIMTASQMHQVSLLNVKYCLQTHPHADHFDPSHFLSRSADYGVVGAPVLHFYASKETINKANEIFRRDLDNYSLVGKEAEEKLNLRIYPIESFLPFTFGNYRVVAYPAAHLPNPGAMLFAVESEGRSIFYGTDTTALKEEVWNGFHRFDQKFDVVILDHTYGLQETGTDHLSALQVFDHAKRLRNEGILKTDGRIFATHIAHQGNTIHSVLASQAEEMGYQVAYDGLILEI